MIDTPTAVVMAVLLVVAALFEVALVTKERKHMLYARVLCAVGFMTLAGRIVTILVNGDLVRLHIAGVLPICTIAVGRIYASAYLMRNWPNWVSK